MRPSVRLSIAGFLATAVAYGPGRMGFGLFLPQFRETFGMGTAQAGTVSSVGFAGFLLALLAAHAMTARYGPRLPVVTGGALATAGLGLVALAQGPVTLALGIVLALSSAGFAWSPFNNAVHRTVSDARRGATLEIISTGTTVGVALAGGLALALVAGALPWRMAWAAFAAAGALAAFAGGLALRDLAGEPGPSDGDGLVTLRDRMAWPLYTAGFLHGAVSSVWVSFAADRVVSAGGFGAVPSTGAPVAMFLAFGLGGFAGLWADEVKAKLGLP